jgi:hypothetical protein
MKYALARVVIALGIITVAAIACRQGDPLEPKTPPNSPLPTKLDRPDDSPSPKAPKLPTGDSGTLGVR